MKTGDGLSDTTEREIPPKIPPDWRDWINDFPSIKSVALICVLAWITTPAMMIVAGALAAKGYVTDQRALDFMTRLISIWLDALNWLTLAAVFGVVTKRATEKPDVIRAEGEVEAAKIAAAAAATAPAQPTGQPAAQPVGAPHPNQNPAISNVIDGAAAQQKAWMEQLEREKQAKLARQAGTQFERDPG